jgi:hypothetical protein
MFHKLREFFWDHRTWIGRAITISLIIHLGLLVVSGFIVILRAFSKPQAQFASVPPTRPALDPRQLEMKVRMEDLQKSGGRPRLTPRMMTQRPSEVALPEIKKLPETQRRKVQREFSALGVSGFGSGFGSGSGSGMGGSVGITLPRIMSGRCDPFERMRRLEQSGGSEDCEKAVVAALKWLAATQNSDGSWGKEFKASMTGLALLAFLGHCETPTSGQFQPTVRKAIDYLVGLGGGGKLALTSGNPWAYEHGIATYALAEAYTMTKEDAIVPVLQRAVGVIVGGQSGEGGWVYGYKSSDIDMSVTGWQVQALRAAQLTGLNIGGVDTAITKAAKGIQEMATDNGHFKYRHKGGEGGAGGRKTLTGAGLLSLLYLKEGTSAEVRDGFKALLEAYEGDRYSSAAIYAWYYNTQACFHRGDPVWSKWRRTFQKELLKAQLPSGAWAADGGSGAASSGAAKADAEIYRTCLATLMLEVYYRYLPTGK